MHMHPVQIMHRQVCRFAMHVTPTHCCVCAISQTAVSGNKYARLSLHAPAVRCSLEEAAWHMLLSSPLLLDGQSRMIVPAAHQECGLSHALS